MAKLVDPQVASPGAEALYRMSARGASPPVTNVADIMQIASGCP